MRHQEHVVYYFLPVSQHSNCSSPNQQKRSSSLSCGGLLFPDSLVKNSTSGHPWHTNLPSIPHLAHLWQQYGLRLHPLLLLVNMLKQMFYNPCRRHLTLASLRGVHQGLYRFIYPHSAEGYWCATTGSKLSSAGLTPYHPARNCQVVSPTW